MVAAEKSGISTHWDIIGDQKSEIKVFPAAIPFKHNNVVPVLKRLAVAEKSGVPSG